MADIPGIISSAILSGLGSAEEQRKRDDLLRAEEEKRREFDTLRTDARTHLDELRRQHDLQYGLQDITDEVNSLRTSRGLDRLPGPIRVRGGAAPAVIAAYASEPKYMSVGDLQNLGVLNLPPIERTVTPEVVPIPPDYTDVRPSAMPATIRDVVAEEARARTKVHPEALTFYERMTRPTMIAVAPGADLVDQTTGQIIHSTPPVEKPESTRPVPVAPGHVLVDPQTGEPIYTAPPDEMGQLRKERLQQQIDIANAQKDAGNIIASIQQGKPVNTEVATRVQQRLLVGAQTYDKMWSDNPAYQEMFKAAKEEMMMQAAFIASYIKKQRSGGPATGNPAPATGGRAATRAEAEELKGVARTKGQQAALDTAKAKGIDVNLGVQE